MNRPAAALTLAGLLLLMMGVAHSDESAPEGAKEGAVKVGLGERVTVRLAQLDVTFSGSPPVLAGLSKETLELWVGGKEVGGFALDLNCKVDAGPRDQRSARPTEQVTYLFFFDLPQLTILGRERSVELSRELVSRLIHDGSKGMIVANAKSLMVIQDLTADPSQLLEALDKINGLEVSAPGVPDQESVREEALQREARLAEEERKGMNAALLPMIDRTKLPEQVKKELKDQAAGGTLQSAVTKLTTIAGQYRRDETARAEASLERLSYSLARFAEGKGPKAVVYFGDTIRSNPGEFYFKALEEAAPRLTSDAAPPLTLDVAKQGRPFGIQRVVDLAINEAAWRGVRFYTVQAEGLTGSSRRVHDAQSTLSALALETGGKAFLNGLEAAKIADGIEGDLACTGIISFDPQGFPEDEPLRVHLVVKDKRVRARTRGRIVIPSELARSTGEILSKALNAKATDPSGRLAVNLIPVGSKDGDLRALVQVGVLGSVSGSGRWELGATLFSRGTVRSSFSRSISVTDPRVPVVLEEEVTLRPGRYEFVAVAREADEEVISRWLDGEWAGGEIREAAISPIAVVQPVKGGFVRQGQTRTAGSLAIPEEIPLSADAPTAIVTLVCAREKTKGRFKVERRLIGEETTEFPAAELDGSSKEEPCIQLRDTIPPRTLGVGYYRYELRVLAEAQEVATATRAFHVAAAASNSADLTHESSNLSRAPRGPD